MRSLFLLAVACAACAPDADEPADTASGAADYATQLDAPAPDYAALIGAQETPAPRDTSIEASGPLPPDAKAVGQLWIDRLEARDALGGMGLAGKGPDGPVIMIDARMPRGEFDAMVKANGWTVPKHIAFSFVDALSYPAVAKGLEGKVRYWPQAKGRTGAQNMAALYGQVLLRDGCFFVKDFAGKESLAWFLAETGLSQDPEGYLTLIDRRTGWTMGRVGERMIWAGPNADPTPAQTKDLRAACGDRPVREVGNPEAEARMETIYPHLRDTTPPPPPPK